MEAIILTWNKEESNPLQVKPGEENSPGFLFFGNAPRKEKLKENAEENTQQILVVYNTDTNTMNAYWSFFTSYSIGLFSLHILSDIYRTFIGHYKAKIYLDPFLSPSVSISFISDISDKSLRAVLVEIPYLFA